MSLQLQIPMPGLLPGIHGQNGGASRGGCPGRARPWEDKPVLHPHCGGISFPQIALRFMTASWNIAELLLDLAGRGQHPAVIAFGENRVVTWGSTTVANKALRLAAGCTTPGSAEASGSRYGRPTPETMLEPY
jgi:hypothetical protein